MWRERGVNQLVAFAGAALGVKLALAFGQHASRQQGRQGLLDLTARLVCGFGDAIERASAAVENLEEHALGWLAAGFTQDAFEKARDQGGRTAAAPVAANAGQSQVHDRAGHNL